MATAEDIYGEFYGHKKFDRKPAFQTGKGKPMTGYKVLQKRNESYSS
jgi:hypothetical protein